MQKATAVSYLLIKFPLRESNCYIAIVNKIKNLNLTTTMHLNLGHSRASQVKILQILIILCKHASISSEPLAHLRLSLYLSTSVANQILVSDGCRLEVTSLALVVAEVNKYKVLLASHITHFTPVYRIRRKRMEGSVPLSSP